MYIYICIHAYIDIYIHTYTYTYIYAWIYTYIHMQIYVHIHICIYICICTHVYISLHNSCMRACATVQQLPCHGSYCELILSLGRTSCRLSFPPALLPFRRAGRPPAGPFTDLFAKKSVQIHASSWRGRRCSVARASSDHPRWCRPHQICLWFTLAHGRGSHPRQKSIFEAIFAGFCSVWTHLHNGNLTRCRPDCQKKWSWMNSDTILFLR